MSAPRSEWLAVLIETAQDTLDNDGGYLAADERAQITEAVASARRSPLPPERLQFARELADPDWSLSVPEPAKAVIRDLLAALTTAVTP